MKAVGNGSLRKIKSQFNEKRVGESFNVHQTIETTAANQSASSQRVKWRGTERRKPGRRGYGRCTGGGSRGGGRNRGTLRNTVHYFAIEKAQRDGV